MGKKLHDGQPDLRHDGAPGLFGLSTDLILDEECRPTPPQDFPASEQTILDKWEVPSQGVFIVDFLKTCIIRMFREMMSIFFLQQDHQLDYE